MRPSTLLSALALATLWFQGCGGGGSNTTAGNGRLTARALWEQPDRAGTRRGFATIDQAQGFGNPIPAAVNSVVIRFQSAIEAQPHCVAVDPDDVPVDPSTGLRLVVLQSLPAGPGSVSIFGFTLDAESAGEVCLGLRTGTPSFASEPHPVEIIAGTRTDAGDIEVFAQPFPLIENPPQNSSTSSPVSLRLVVVVSPVAGVGGIDPESILLDLSQNGDPIDDDFLATPCDDFATPLCSPGGELEVVGYLLTTDATVFDEGAATVRVRAATSGANPRLLDFTYGFTVQTPAGGTVSGNVVNCLNNEPIAGARIESVDPMLAPVVAGDDGSFLITGFPFGSFTLAASAAGFIDSRISGTLIPSDPEQALTIALCPRGGNSGARIVLTWGDGPPASKDLDAHLRGPVPALASALVPVEFHLDFTNADILFAIGGAATLDIDSTEFRGPETETVDTLIAGVYHFCVHDFSDRELTGATGLASSNASVQLFVGDQQLGEFVAPDTAGNLWDVFQLDTTGQQPVVTAINTMSDQRDRGLVCHRPDDADGDGLTDTQEQSLTTDPNNPDSNANGVSDGQDVINGDSPLPPST